MCMQNNKNVWYGKEMETGNQQLLEIKPTGLG